MKSPYIFIISALLLSSLNSCSPYKNSTTTPDDVYYSPGAPAKQATTSQSNGTDYYSTPNDNYVQMRVQDPQRWSYFDDYNYDYYGGYSPYGYGSSVSMSIGFGMGYYSPWYFGFGYYSPMSYYNSYYAWNSFYNPYYGGVVVINGKNTATPSYTRLTNFNPSAYNGRYYNSRPAKNFSNAASSSNFRNTPGTNTNSNFSRPTYSSPTMRSSPSNFSSGGSGGMRSGGFSRPGR